MRSYKYQLVDTYQVETGIHLPGLPISTEYIDMGVTGRLTIRAGYAWDGPSWPAIDTANFLRGSLPHDALYQLMRMGLLPLEKRGEVDCLLRRHCLEDGMSSVRAALVYAGVRAGGWTSVRPRPELQLLVREAP